MANRPSSDFSYLSPPSPIQLCSSFATASEPSSDIHYTRDLSLPPLHPPYQHYSHLRSTDSSQPSLQPHFYHDSSQPACCPKMIALGVPAPPSPCDECVVECEEGECELELTEQCTDQCVVVPCHDVHYPSCDDASDKLSCDMSCLDDADCSALDNFMDCCSDYRQFFNDMKPTNDAPGTFGWPPFYDNMFQGYPAPSPSTNPAFYSAGSSASTPQLVPSPSSFVTSAPSALPSPAPSTHHPFSVDHSDASANRLPCMWGDCNACFATMNELVGHVNLQHLRLPPPSGAPSTSTDPQLSISPQRAQLDDANPLSCLWADCQVYPTPDSIPGPSSGDHAGSVLGVLANHLLQDHLGLASRSLNTSVLPAPQSQSQSQLQSEQPFQPSSAPQSTPLSPVVSGPLTPAPEHDCSAPHAHVCRWKDCGTSFDSCDALTTHITSAHVGGGKAHYDCYWEGCARHGDNGFASKQKICRHLQSHTGHRPFQCAVCQQNFSEAATLAQHMRRHTQEKPYACDFPGCGKSFAITGALTIHKRTHNGHKPFKCTYCDRAFSESSNLSKHLRTHTGARPYPCTEPGCIKTFARPDQLARHMTVHRKKDVKLVPLAVQAAA